DVAADDTVVGSEPLADVPQTTCDVEDAVALHGTQHTRQRLRGEVGDALVEARAKALVEGGELGPGQVERLVLQVDDVHGELPVHPAGDAPEELRVAQDGRQVAIEGVVDPQRRFAPEPHATEDPAAAPATGRSPVDRTAQSLGSSARPRRASGGPLT